VLRQCERVQRSDFDEPLHLTARTHIHAGFAGSKNFYAYAASRTGLNSGWQSRGKWTVGAPSRCDPRAAGNANAADGQQMINEVLGTAAPSNDLNRAA
jgi:hypothetical protein